MKRGLLIVGFLFVLLSLIIGLYPKMNAGMNAGTNAEMNTEANETVDVAPECKFEGFYVIVIKDLATHPRIFRILPENAYKDSFSGIPIFDFVMKPGETAYVCPILSPFNNYGYTCHWHLLDGSIQLIDTEGPNLLIIKTMTMGSAYVGGRIELCIDYHGTSPIQESFYLQIR